MVEGREKVGTKVEASQRIYSRGQRTSVKLQHRQVGNNSETRGRNAAAPNVQAARRAGINPPSRTDQRADQLNSTPV